MRTVAIAALLFALAACSGPASPDPDAPGVSGSRTTGWYPKVDPQALAGTRGVSFIDGLSGYQQTTEYTCGPAALLALARFYGATGIGADAETEMRIAREAGSRSLDVLKTGGKPGTTPGEMKAWLESHGFDVRLDYEDKGDGSGLALLRKNAERGIPTIVEWADLGGHWVIVVGYDTRGTDDPWDDVLIFADSYDRYDDYRDGYSFVNANRFYWLWYDAFCFDTLTWRTALAATPKGSPPPQPVP